MIIKASAGRAWRKASVTEHCEKLTLQAQADIDPRWLANLWRVMFRGGRILIEHADGARVERTWEAEPPAAKNGEAKP